MIRPHQTCLKLPPQQRRYFFKTASTTQFAYSWAVGSGYDERKMLPNRSAI
jgi:hypothetical protein